MPRVSVVIPTHNRPSLIGRAVNDALSQTLRDLEVIVVIDGPDPDTAQALASIDDARLRILQHERNLGPSVARNHAIQEATGDWIALQDDDDEWFPQKLELQLASCQAAAGGFVFSLCRYRERTSDSENIRPETMPSPADTGKQFVEYMYCHRGLLLPCVVMVSRALALRCPFDETMRLAEDSDFFIRCLAEPGVELTVVPDVLAIHNNVAASLAKGQYRLSSAGSWREVLAWAVRQRRLFTGRAFAFLLTRSITQMASDRGASFRDKLSILRIAMLQGSFSPRVVLYFLASALLTKRGKNRIRLLLSSKARAQSVRIKTPLRSLTHE